MTTALAGAAPEAPPLDARSWLVSARFDLWAFGAPAAGALLLVLLAPWLAPDGVTPLPMWIVGVLAVDVAHVWATLFVTYLDPGARVRFAAPLLAAPLAAFLGAAALAHASPAWFWRVLAYVAVFHFVRQQYGWVRLHHRRDPDLSALDRRLDVAAIYLGTLYPLLWWHAHLPRRFSWFVPGDFVGPWLEPRWVEALGVFPAAVLLAFVLRQVWLRWRGEPWRAGKALVVLTTAACWGVGIVATDSDWSFTVTNVFIHGVPYLAYVGREARRRRARRDGAPGGALAFVLTRGWAFYGVLVLLAYAEEWGWDRLLWREGGVFFGPTPTLGPVGEAWALAALSVPQITHYLLDGLIWRRPGAGPP